MRPDFRREDLPVSVSCGWFRQSGLDTDPAAVFKLSCKDFLSSLCEQGPFSIFLIGFPEPVIIKRSIGTVLLSLAMTFTFPESA